MKLNALKISDGDLIIVTHAQYSSSTARPVVHMLEQWISRRGLNDVEIETVDSGLKDSEVSVSVITVNDIFDREVLGN